MDFQNRVGTTFGGGSVSTTDLNAQRKERLRKLAMETIDLSKDPYFMRNHLGSYECKLCLTLHPNEGSYLAHTQGKRHQASLAKRAALEAKEAEITTPVAAPVAIKKVAVKIGRPGYRVTKVKNDQGLLGLLFQIAYPDITAGVRPRHRFMSSFEQRQQATSKYFQYLLFAAEPYEIIAFKIQSYEVDKSDDAFLEYWDPVGKQYHLQFFFKNIGK